MRGDRGTIGSSGQRQAPEGRRRRRLMPAPPQGQQALVDALDSVAEAISSAHSVHDVLAAIVDAAKRYTGTEKVLICLVDEYAAGPVLDASTLVVRGSRGEHDQEWWGARLDEIAADVFAAGRPYFEADEQVGAWLLAVPVRAQSQPLGVLVALNAIHHALRPDHTAFLSILGAFAAVSIANARLAEEGRYAMLAGERERIAREMHDGISQSLFSISLGLELVKKQQRKDVLAAASTVDDLQRQLTASSAELRRLIYDLRPARLQELGLVESVRAWVREATQGSGITGTLEVTGQACHLSPAQEACLYRVAKEAVSNAVRHSGGAALRVAVAFGPDRVTLDIVDDGNGLRSGDTVPRLAGTGAGLRNMKDRMAAQGGTLVVSSGEGSGTVVRATLPLEV